MDPPEAALLDATFRGVSLLVALQVATRAITFLLNVLVARNLAPDVYGVASVQMHLVMTTTLFLSREGIRKACQRMELGAEEDPVRRTHMMNLAWMALPLSLIWGGGVAAVFLRQSPPDMPLYREAVFLFVGASVVEIVCEPLYMLAQNRLEYRLRVRIEGFAVVVRCVLTYVLVMFTNLGIVAFGLAQLGYALVVTGLYFVSFLGRSTSLWRILPQKATKRDGWIDAKMGRVAVHFTLQSLEKLFLTEGEKYVLVSMKDLKDQGVFGLVSNLGSLVARLLFLPIEEQSATTFSKLQAQYLVDRASGNRDKAKGSVLVLARLLSILLKGVILIGLTFVAFGWNYADLLLLLFGKHWLALGAAHILSWYCVYILVIAVNGVTEAFVHAVASDEEVRRKNVLLLWFSAFYLLVSVGLVTTLDTIGLILANCLNMGLRVTHSLLFIHTFFEEEKTFSLRNCLPSPTVLVMFALSAAVTRLSAGIFFADPTNGGIWEAVAHVAVGGLCLSGVLFAIYRMESRLLVDLRALMRRSKERVD